MPMAQGFLLLPDNNKKQFRGSSKEVQDTCRSRNNGSNPLPLVFSAIIPELTGCMSVSIGHNLPSAANYYSKGD